MNDLSLNSQFRSLAWSSEIFPLLLRAGLWWLCVSSARLTALAQPDSIVAETRSNREQTTEANLDLLFASDLTVSESSLAYRNKGNGFEFGINANHAAMDLDYRPNAIADILGQTKGIATDRLGAQIYLNLSVSSQLTWRLGGGFYDGYTNYRTLWLDEYYRQQFSRLIGYEDADPYGINGLTGLRWEYLPATGIMEINLNYQRDVISPGYDRPLFQPLDRGRDLLRTGAVNLSLEQVLTPKLRGRLQYRLTDTTNRSLRQAVQVSLNYSLTENWVLRSVLGRTSERTGFRSHAAEMTLDHDWNDRWFLGIGGRFYRDNGDIENSLFVASTAAPDLTARQIFLSLRWLGSRSAFRWEIGPYQTDYAPPNSIVAPFSFLYSDRNFLRVGFSYTYGF